MPRNLRVPSARGNTPRDSNDCLIAQRSTWGGEFVSPCCAAIAVVGPAPTAPLWVGRSAPSQRAASLSQSPLRSPATGEQQLATRTRTSRWRRGPNAAMQDVTAYGCRRTHRVPDGSERTLGQ